MKLVMSVAAVVVSMIAGALPNLVAEESLAGKRVVVIRDKAPLEVSGKEVAKASECTVFTVKSERRRAV